MKATSDWKQMKEKGEKITMVTAYDYPSAKQSEAAGMDTILVGDSLGMTVLGYASTVQVTMDDMIHHARAVRRGAPDTYVVVDMPFGTYHGNVDDSVQNALDLYQATDANAIKLEGAGCIDIIRRAVAAGVPVVAHLGLTPQSVGVTGFRMQASDEAAAMQLIQDAKAVESAGASMLVLEAIPSDLAEKVTAVLGIPTIGIGAGVNVDGQVLVYHDVLQYGTERLPKFVRPYADFNTAGVQGLKSYVAAVKAGEFPDVSTTYKRKVFEE
ncbi:3-methyl-2-oxobutanoate hydroxymethyltransferase [Salinicoccus sp. ID82-1]|uniref:3-methyl-2-oxobutanoate hydroxymethyltransferase n=1 Tax=Salinicoccus sp. ID82-1 TaxID=2820269 RepID=UPI001F001EE1|nr:3-methyl-2-oxobutanoate hydroxymethyltransferase [Salinicoccus sp. ID82-1]MCG1008776.1 3-methyl-2-oxobutanoate hydroxymethyltransferase [Salinicoccus sp. ID82-1]